MKEGGEQRVDVCARGGVGGQVTVRRIAERGELSLQEREVAGSFRDRGEDLDLGLGKGGVIRHQIDKAFPDRFAFGRDWNRVGGSSDVS